MQYLEVAEGSITILPDRRDWHDFQTEMHVNYHRAAMTMAGENIVVTVDARDVPFAALLHIKTFAAIAAVVRQEYKNTVRAIVIKDASYVVSKLYSTMCRLGYIGTLTREKIQFISSQNKKSI